MIESRVCLRLDLARDTDLDTDLDTRSGLFQNKVADAINKAGTPNPIPQPRAILLLSFWRAAPWLPEFVEVESPVALDFLVASVAAALPDYAYFLANPQSPLFSETCELTFEVLVAVGAEVLTGPATLAGAGVTSKFKMVALNQSKPLPFAQQSPASSTEPQHQLRSEQTVRSERLPALSTA